MILNFVKQAPADMLEAAKKALLVAYSPYSNFSVGVCLRAAGGQLFNGCNIENHSYSLTLCAEASALSAMISAGHNRWIEALIISSGKQFCSPCGACRQRLYEFALPESLFYLCTAQGDNQIISMADLLPLPFNF